MKVFFKKALYIRLTEHLNINKLLVGNPFGFRKVQQMKMPFLTLILLMWRIRWA